MKVNVSHNIVVKDGGQVRSLLPDGNPHTVSDDVGRTLVKDGLATAEASAKEEKKDDKK